MRHRCTPIKGLFIGAHRCASVPHRWLKLSLFAVNRNQRGAAMFLQKPSYYDKTKAAVSDAWDDVDDVTAARALGVVSVVIGLSEILFPRKLQKTMGINNGQNTGVMRVLGVR